MCFLPSRASIRFCGLMSRWTIFFSKACWKPWPPAGRSNRRCGTGSGPALRPAGEVLALDVLHGEGQQFADLQGAVGRDDVGMVEHGRRLDLAQEAVGGARPIEQSLVHDLEHFQPVHELVPGQVHHAHPAATQFPQDLVLRIVGQLRRQVGGPNRAKPGADSATIAQGADPMARFRNLGQRTPPSSSQQRFRRQQLPVHGVLLRPCASRGPVRRKLSGAMAAAALRQIRTVRKVQHDGIDEGVIKFAQTECLQGVRRGMRGNGGWHWGLLLLIRRFRRFICGICRRSCPRMSTAPQYKVHWRRRHFQKKAAQSINSVASSRNLLRTRNLASATEFSDMANSRATCSAERPSRAKRVNACQVFASKSDCTRSSSF